MTLENPNGKSTRSAAPDARSVVLDVKTGKYKGKEVLLVTEEVSFTT